jgi:hypothetical protein
VFETAAQRYPLRLHGAFVGDDAVARQWVRELRDAQEEPALDDLV